MIYRNMETGSMMYEISHYLSQKWGKREREHEHEQLIDF